MHILFIYTHCGGISGSSYGGNFQTTHSKDLSPNNMLVKDIMEKIDRKISNWNLVFNHELKRQ